MAVFALLLLVPAVLFASPAMGLDEPKVTADEGKPWEVFCFGMAPGTFNIVTVDTSGYIITCKMPNDPRAKNFLVQGQNQVHMFHQQQLKFYCSHTLRAKLKSLPPKHLAHGIKQFGCVK